MARQCTQPKRLKNSEWFMEKMLLAQAQEVRTDDLDAFDSDCDEAPSASAVLMAKLSAYDSDVLSKVPNYDTYQDNNVIDQSVQEMQYSEQPIFVDDSDIDITSDSNVISYDQYMKDNENRENKIINESLTAELERYKEMVKFFEERQSFDLNDHKKYIDSRMRVTKEEHNNQQLKDHIAKLKGKSVSDCTAPVNNSTMIALGMFKLDLPPLSPKFKKNREVHVDYLKQTKEHANTIREIVEQARDLKPLDNISRNESEKLVAVTPMNKNRKVKFGEPSTSISNTQKHVEGYSNQNTNRPLFPSTGVKHYTNASGSKPRSNTRKNRISRTSSSNMKNTKSRRPP
ncbi:hypothetical protein Tco_1493643 [Tanacetum coccineum]